MPQGKKRKKVTSLPDQLNLFSTTWKIVYGDSPYDVGDAKESSGPLFGQCDYIGRTISIYRGDRSVPDIWKTLFHEILHAVINEMGLHDIEDLESYEGVVDALSTAFVDIIVRNNLDLLKK